MPTKLDNHTPYINISIEETCNDHTQSNFITTKSAFNLCAPRGK